MNTSYVQIRNELASEQLIKVQFQVAMSGRYIEISPYVNLLQLQLMHITYDGLKKVSVMPDRYTAPSPPPQTPLPPCKVKIPRPAVLFNLSGEKGSINKIVNSAVRDH